MPFQNLAPDHLSAADMALFDSLLTQAAAILQPNLRNLTPEENKKCGSINENHKLFVNKVEDYHLTQPAKQSPDVDWPEFDRDFNTRKFYETRSIRLRALAKAMEETKRLHDHDNYQNALIDYDYTKYKDRTDAGAGYDSKLEDLSQFFSKRGGSSLEDGTDKP